MHRCPEYILRASYVIRFAFEYAAVVNVSVGSHICRAVEATARPTLSTQVQPLREILLQLLNAPPCSSSNL